MKQAVRNRIVNSKGDTVYYIISGVIMSILLVIALYPMIFVLSASFSSGDAVSSGRVVLWPVELNLETRYIRITADPENGQGNYGSDYYGLSEVRFTQKLELRDIVEVASIAVSSEIMVMSITALSAVRAPAEFREISPS